MTGSASSRPVSLPILRECASGSRSPWSPAPQRPRFAHAMGHHHTILIPLLLVPALFLGWQEWGFRADQDDFSAVATTIAGRDVRIECQRFTGALLDPTAEAGYVPFNADGSPTDTGRLERDACNDLRDYIHGDQAIRPSSRSWRCRC